MLSMQHKSDCSLCAPNANGVFERQRSISVRRFQIRRVQRRTWYVFFLHLEPEQKRFSNPSPRENHVRVVNPRTCESEIVCGHDDNRAAFRDFLIVDRFHTRDRIRPGPDDGKTEGFFFYLLAAKSPFARGSIGNDSRKSSRIARTKHFRRRPVTFEIYICIYIYCINVNGDEILDKRPLDVHGPWKGLTETKGVLSLPRVSRKSRGVCVRAYTRVHERIKGPIQHRRHIAVQSERNAPGGKELIRKRKPFTRIRTQGERLFVRPVQSAVFLHRIPSERKQFRREGRRAPPFRDNIQRTFYTLFRNRSTNPSGLKQIQ